MSAPVRPTLAIRFGDFEADLQAGQLRKLGFRIKLQEQPFQILVLMLEHPGEVVTREELRQRLWPGDTFVDFDHGLNNAINRLREALNDSADAPRFIETLPRRGYRFIAEVDGQASTPPQATVLTDSIETEEVASAKGAGGGAVAKPSPVALLHRMGRFWLIVAGAGIAAVLIFGLYFGRQRLFGASAAVRIQSVAVLPLDNLSGDPSQDYFADGMTDALTTYLAQLHGLRVISRTSAMQYKASKRRLPEIARELNVDGVIEGTVQRSGDRVFVTAQLIDGKTDRHLWAKSYEMAIGDMLSVESRVARDVAQETQVRLTPEEQARLSRAHNVDPQAYDYYLRARPHSGLASAEDNTAAIELLERAVAADPSFAQAQATLAMDYNIRAVNLEPRNREWEEKASAATAKALALDPDLAEAYLARGSILWTHPNHFPHERAIRECRRALTLNPNLAEAHETIAHIYNHIGLLDKGQEEIEKAVALDPLNTAARFRVGMNLLYQGKYEQSLAAIRDSQRFWPSGWAFQASFALYHLGKMEEAAARVEEFLRKQPEDAGGLLASMQALFAATAGDKRRAEERIRRAIKLGEGYQHFHHTAYAIASAYALMNKPEPALRFLRTAAEDGFPCYPLFEGDESLSNLRNDPRFVQFMAELKKQWEQYKATL